MDKTLPKLYREYGQYSNFRNFPLDIDGLKPVERRVLLSAFKIAKDRMVKSRQVDSYTTGHYHPHGECIEGNTRIPLLDGTFPYIKDLIGKKNFWVYSCKKDGSIVPGLAHSVKVTKECKIIYKVILNNNKFFKCTKDHLVMLRNGNFKEAKDLAIGESLMPLYLRKEDGYTFYKTNNTEEKFREEKTAWMVIRNLVNENIDNLLGRKKYHSHHKDENRGNDSPENLELISNKKHCSITGSRRSNEANKTIGKKVKKKYETDSVFRKSALKGLKKGREKMFNTESPIREKIKRKNSELMTAYNKRYVKDRAVKILKYMIDNNIDINIENYENNRKMIYNGPFWNTVIEKFGSIKEAIDQAENYNHTVKKIEVICLETPIKVYDMSVEEYHNFAIGSGIFVHNCYGTIVQLVRQGFLVGQGNFGTSIGVEPVGAAAPRYTECKINEKSLDLAFIYIKHVPWIDTELGDKEPLFLPTMYPICLLGNEYTMGIGFGYKTFIPCYNIKDLYKRLSWLLKERKTKPTIVPISNCKIVSSNVDLELLLTTGKAKIAVEGIIDQNLRTNTVTLRSWPPGKRFESLLNKFSKEMETGSIGYTDLSSALTGTEIVFKVLRERNRDKIFNDFVSQLKEALKGTISFETTVVDTDQKVMVKSIDDMLLDTYKMFTSINEVRLKEEIKQLNKIISEYITLDIIRKPLSDCIGSGLNINESIIEVTKKTQMQPETIKDLIGKYKIQKLLTLDTDISGLNNRKTDFQNNLKNLTQFVLEQYK